MYGELSQIQSLEQRMAELFPEDPKLQRFASRFTSEDKFDPTAVRPIISPEKQMRPKAAIMDSIEQPPVQDSPRPQFSREDKSPRPSFFQGIQNTHSPKRPYPPGDDSDGELNRPRKLARGESPLKGAAGRRLEQQQKRLHGGGGGYGSGSHPQQPPASVPPMVSFLLSIMPRPALYDSYKISPEGLVQLLARTQLPDPDALDGQQQVQRQPMQYGSGNGMNGMNNGMNAMNGMTSNQTAITLSSMNTPLGDFNSLSIGGGGLWNPASQVSSSSNGQSLSQEQAAQWLFANAASMMNPNPTPLPLRVQDLSAADQVPRQPRHFHSIRNRQYRRRAT